MTGGSGLLGGAIASAGRKAGYDMVVGYNSHTLDDSSSIKLDIIDDQSVSKAIEKEKPDVVIHAAAMTDVDRCEMKPTLAYDVNVEGTRNIVRVLKKSKAFLINVSTDYVFSGTKGNYSEEDKTGPVNVYGSLKLEAETMVSTSLDDWCTVRPSVIYGSSPAVGKTNFVLWLINKLRNSEHVDIVTDQIVSPTLNTSLAEMILEVAERRTIGMLHLTGATQMSRFDFAMEIAERFDLDTDLIRPVTSEEMSWVARRPINSSLDVSKATRVLGVKPLRVKEAVLLLKGEMEARGGMKGLLLAGGHGTRLRPPNLNRKQAHAPHS